MKIGWGWKIAMVYGGFVVLIVTLVVGSMRQNFDLVSDKYYDEEIAFQKVIDAGKNQAALSRPVVVHSGPESVVINFPEEFRNKALDGNVLFYSPVNSTWDKTFPLSVQGDSVIVNRSDLRNTTYIIKINWQAEGRKYYQESEITLHS
jgi:nitrogen fixation protein FixH